MKARSLAVKVGLVSALLATPPGSVHAEAGKLIVNIVDYAGRPVEKVRIGTRGDGSVAVSDVFGKARIKLAANTQVGQIVTLR